MKKLTPYLMFSGDCEEALNFYKNALNGEIKYLGRYADSPMDVPKEHKNKVMHAELKWDGGTIMAADYLKGLASGKQLPGEHVQLNLSFTDEAEMMTVFNALKAGGEVIREVKEMFWGDKFGMLTDKYGTRWLFNCLGNKK